MAVKKLRGKSNSKEICRCRMAHRDCLDKFCVLCFFEASSGFVTCKSCGARIHVDCASRESRRPDNRKLGHSWSTTVAKERSDPNDITVVDEIVAVLQCS